MLCWVDRLAQSRSVQEHLRNAGKVVLGASGYSILLSIPFIGPWLTYLLLGGTVPVDVTDAEASAGEKVATQ